MADAPLARAPSHQDEKKSEAPEAQRPSVDFPRATLLESRSSPVFPHWMPRQPRRAFFAVKEPATALAVARGVPGEGARSERAPVRRSEPAIKEAAAERRAPLEAKPVAPPPARRPILRFLPEHKPQAVPVGYDGAGAHLQEPAPAPVFPAQPSGAPPLPPDYATGAATPRCDGPAWPPPPATSSRRRADRAEQTLPPPVPPRPRFDATARKTVREPLFSAMPSLDRWPELPAASASPAPRTPHDGERLSQLIQDQTERSWNG